MQGGARGLEGRMISQNQDSLFTKSASPAHAAFDKTDSNFPQRRHRFSQITHISFVRSHTSVSSDSIRKFRQTRTS
eukprot:1648687-Pleurochrysis_carterae.AAC.2